MFTHLSRNEFTKLRDNGMFFMPTTRHMTACWKEVSPEEIDNENPTCEECQDWKYWDMIDAENKQETSTCP